MMKNDKIKQLAAQHGLYDGWFCGQDNIERFAIDLIKTCAATARATPCPYDNDEMLQRLGHTWDMACIEAGREIVTQFGVE